LSIDPLAERAEAQEQLRKRLMELAPAGSEELRAAWQAAAKGVLSEKRGRISKNTNVTFVFFEIRPLFLYGSRGPDIELKTNAYRVAGLL